MYLIFIVLYLIEGKSEIKKKLKVIKEIEKSDFKNAIKEENNIKFVESPIKDENEKSKKTKKRKKHSRKTENYPPKKKSNVNNDLKICIQSKNDIAISNDKISKSENISINNKNHLKKLRKRKLGTTKAINNFNNIDKEKLDNYELNNLEYNQAINLDKRKISEIYWSLLKREHLILFTFLNGNDYNISFIKFEKLIFSVSTDLALNAIFYADETIHKMFLENGKYNFIQQIPQIMYSIIVSQSIQVLIDFLSFTDKHYYEIKNINSNKEIRQKNLIKCIKLKIIYFFLFTSFMIAFYWYFISCFCAVYKNTQIYYIIDSVISFCLGLVYPFILYLFPSLLRMLSLKYYNKNLLYVYKISKLIPLF